MKLPGAPARPFRRPQGHLAGYAFVALGSNLGDSRQTVLRAANRLRQLSCAPLLRSALWETAPVDCPPGAPLFINAIVALQPRSGETPESLLAKLLELETEFGRQPKKVLNEPRRLDLDLILFGNEIRVSAQLTLPHPRALHRRFVLQPLSELAPDLVFPGQSEAVAQLLDRLPTDPAMRKL
jgi:2-amino-4-hydroxy-6-hydroxymethyldihydropteridine diphosphokinase